MPECADLFSLFLIAANPDKILDVQFDNLCLEEGPQQILERFNANAGSFHLCNAPFFL